MCLNRGHPFLWVEVNKLWVYLSEGLQQLLFNTESLVICFGWPARP